MCEKERWKRQDRGDQFRVHKSRDYQRHDFQNCIYHWFLLRTDVKFYDSTSIVSEPTLNLLNPTSVLPNNWQRIFLKLITSTSQISSLQNWHEIFLYFFKNIGATHRTPYIYKNATIFFVTLRSQNAYLDAYSDFLIIFFFNFLPIFVLFYE